jgi:hypothetical protein
MWIFRHSDLACLLPSTGVKTMPDFHEIRCCSSLQQVAETAEVSLKIGALTSILYLRQ